MTTVVSAATRRVAGWGTLAAGLSAFVVAVLMAVASARPPANVGDLPVPAGAVAAPSSVAPSVPTARAGRSALPVLAWAPPTRVVAASLHVDAMVTPVGVAGKGLEIPENPARVGWWVGSATPGSPRGTVLVAGHVDTARDGPGALFKLESLPMGATIKVTTEDRTIVYRAVARRTYLKRRLPAALFSVDGPAQLVLVTCGGSFHDGSYSRNIVVYATPMN